MSKDINPVDQLLMQDETNHGFPQSQTQYQNSQEPEKSDELKFLSELSRVCKARKVADPNFDQKSFMKSNLLQKYGEKRASVILQQLHMKLKRQQSLKLQQQKMQQQQGGPPQTYKPLPVSNASQLNQPFPHPTASSSAGMQLQAPDSSAANNKEALKKKDASWAKRKAKGATASSPAATIPSEQQQPPLKKAKKAQAEKVEVAKGKKKTPAVREAPSYSVPSEVKVPVMSSDEDGLEVVRVEEMIPKDTMGVSPFVSDLVVSEGEVGDEARKTTATMRRAVQGSSTMPSVLSRRKGENKGAFDMASSVGQGEGKAVMGKLLLHDAKAQQLCQRVLSAKGMNYTQEALTALADGMQSHFRSLIESTITAFHKRTNRKAKEHFTHMEKVLSSSVTVPNSTGTETTQNVGDVKPENKDFYALSFGPDRAKRIAKEISLKREKVKTGSAVVQDALRQHLQLVDESMKKVQKKQVKGGEKMSGETVGEDIIPWWKKEETLEKEGALSWEQLALTRLKMKVAVQHDLGPRARKKPRKEMAEDFRAPKPMVADSISRNGGVNYAGDADIDQEDFTHPFPDRAVGYKSSAGSAMPLSRTPYRLTKEDALLALTKHTSQRNLCGGRFCAAYGNVLKTAKNCL